MAEPRKATNSIALGGGGGKSMSDLDAQMSRIQRALGDERYLDSGPGFASQNERGRELYVRALAAYRDYSRNIAAAVNPGRPDYETPWLTGEQRNRRVPRSVYMRNNRR